MAQFVAQAQALSPAIDTLARDDRGGDDAISFAHACREAVEVVFSLDFDDVNMMIFQNAGQAGDWLAPEMPPVAQGLCDLFGIFGRVGIQALNRKIGVAVRLRQHLQAHAFFQPLPDRALDSFLRAFAQSGALAVGDEFHLDFRLLPKAGSLDPQRRRQLIQYPRGWRGLAVFVLGQRLLGDGAAHGDGEFLQRKASREAELLEPLAIHFISS